MVRSKFGVQRWGIRESIGNKKGPSKRTSRELLGGTSERLLGLPFHHAQNVPTREAVTVMRMMVPVGDVQHGKERSRCPSIRQPVMPESQLQFGQLVNKFTRPAGPCGHGSVLL